MHTLHFFTDVYGPRLTGSPSLRAAEDWAARRLTEWGLRNAHLEAWGPFGRGWSLESFTASMTEPTFAPLIAYPRAWSPPTRGSLRGAVVYLDVKSEADLAKYRGKLRGALVLFSAPPPVRPHFEPQAHRLSDAELLELANATPTKEEAGESEFARPPSLSYRKWQFVYEEGAAAVLVPGRGDGGIVFVLEAITHPPAGTQAGRLKEPWERDAGAIIPQFVVAAEQYNRMVRLLEKGVAVKVELSVGARYYDDDPMSYNLIGEIAGTDLKDEVVMLGGCLDSWHAGTGATDNAAGAAVALEVMRLLKALDLKPRRTVRIGLWSAEEQGSLGSRAYVAAHLGRRVADAPGPAARAHFEFKPEYEKFSGYFNLDYGTGRIRGVYLQGNEAVRPIFRAWLAPFKDLGADTLTGNDIGATDHVPFDETGLPAFQFLRDFMAESYTRTAHTNMDVYDHVLADDLKQAAVVAAAFVYQAAMMDEKLPRKPMPGR
jgi:hypothetical protein